MGDFKTDLSDSAFDFKRVVWPTLQKALGGGSYIPVEEETAKGLTQCLDIYAGIDAWHVDEENKIMRGLASRIQWCSKGWDTFTIRYKRNSGACTEYEKRIDAINGDRGALYPHLTIQAYVTERKTGELINVGVVNTKDLFLLASQLMTGHPYKDLWGIRETSNATFIWIHWNCIKINDIKMKILYPPDA